MVCFVHDGSNFITAVFQRMVLQSVLLSLKYVWLCLKHMLSDHEDIICEGTRVLCDCSVLVPISSFLCQLFFFFSFSLFSKLSPVFLATV